jgi:protein TonB
MPFFYRFRNTMAALPSLGILILLIGVSLQKVASIQRHVDESVVQIALAEPEPAMQPTPPAPPQPEPKPVPRPPKPAKPTPPAPQRIRPAPPSEPQAETAPAVTPSPTQPTSKEPVESAPPPTPVVAPSPPPPAPAAKPNNASVESDYVARIRAHLNSIKRYPTGREASQQRPQGKTKVWFVLRRDGSLVDFGIDASSNSMLLDEAARKTINRATFPTFPESAWSGEATHRFTAELEFISAAG